MQERQPPSAGSLVWTRGLVWLPDRSAQLDEALCSARLSCFSRFFFSLFGESTRWLFPSRWGSISQGLSLNRFLHAATATASLASALRTRLVAFSLALSLRRCCRREAIRTHDPRARDCELCLCLSFCLSLSSLRCKTDTPCRPAWTEKIPPALPTTPFALTLLSFLAMVLCSLA